MIGWFQSLLKAKLVIAFLRRVLNHTFTPNCSVCQSDSVCFWCVWHVWMCLSKISSLCSKDLDCGTNPHYNPTGVCWRLMPGPCQEKHLPVHHLGVGKPWANGRANPKAHGWDVDAKFDQHGKGNWKSCGPSRPGQRNSRNSVRRAVLIIASGIFQIYFARMLTYCRYLGQFMINSVILLKLIEHAQSRDSFNRADSQEQQFWILLA